MLSLHVLYIVCRDVFYLQYNTQDGSCSFTSSNTENKLYHGKVMCPTELVKKD